MLLIRGQKRIMANVGIVRSWSIDEFKRMKGTPKLGSFQAVDQETGEMRNFKSVVFVDSTNPDPQTNKCFVGFSSNLGELTPAQYKAMRNELQVVELESGSYKLCKQGSGAWEDLE
jgi:hypothetical protein